jgi:hypothetical protein
MIQMQRDFLGSAFDALAPLHGATRSGTPASSKMPTRQQ